MRSEELIWKRSDNARAEEVVYVECPYQPPLGVSYWQRRDAVHFHDVHCFCG